MAGQVNPKLKRRVYMACFLDDDGFQEEILEIANMLLTSKLERIRVLLYERAQGR